MYTYPNTSTDTSTLWTFFPLKTLPKGADYACMVADTVMVDSEGTATVLTTSKKDWAAVTYVI